MTDRERNALKDLVEAVSRGDEVGLPEAYRKAKKVLDNDSWDRQELTFSNKSSAYFLIWQAMEKIPTFSMFTNDARRGMALAIVNELAVKEPEDGATN